MTGKASRIPGRRELAVAALRRHWALLTLLVPAVTLRVLALVAIGPGIWFSDSNVYVQSAATGTLSMTRPVGYSLLVWPFWLLKSAAALIVVQHLIGLGLVVALYALLVHRGVPRRLAALGVLPAALDLYLVLVEHTIMAETVFHAALVGTLALLLYQERPGLIAVGAAGALLGYVGLVRSVGVPMFAVCAVFLFVRHAGWRRVAVFLAAGAMVTAGYAAIYDHQHGSFALTSSSGRFLYGKVAPFADCTRLGELSDAERAICPDPAHRLTPNAYVWSTQSPIQNADPDVAKAFALKVIRHQFGDYADVVVSGFLHYFRAGHHIGPDDYPVEAWQFPEDPRTWAYPGYRGPIRAGIPIRQQRHPITEPNVYASQMAGHSRFDVGVTRFLHDLQLNVYTPGPLLAACVLLVLFALVRRAGDARLRADAALVCGVALVALLTTQAFSVFSYRYGLGLIVLLPAAAALAASALISTSPRS
ncbi:MAG: hypothetical protein QOF76_4377 [Solirubrobacteraceae bacterium]|nr:hypothetical protein [Solirubrobacteraceae bacterium]